MKRRAGFLAAATVAASAAAALGYVFLGSVWNSDRIVMELQLGSSGGRLIDGSSSWNASAESALAIWNEFIRRTQFYVVRGSAAPIGDGNGYNNVFFDNTVYGYSFDGAVAITTEWSSRGVRTEADVILNTNYAWNSYRGPLKKAAGGGTLYDLRRVVMHEFGHVLGLDHPDEAGQSVVAIMNSRVSDVDTVQDDDIAGAQALYGKRGNGVIAEFTKPRKRSVSTTRNRLMFRGTAKSARVDAVYLKNFSRYYRVDGVSRWRRAIPLRMGANRITLYADTGAGRLRKVDRVRVTRQ